MRIGFIGCVRSSKVALETLLDLKGVEVCAVVTRETSLVNTDFFDLSEVCEKHEIPFLYEDPNNREDSTIFLQQYDLDVIYCIGWSYLLNNELLSITPIGVIGFHPAKLPQNRGRHPIIWSLALGLDQTASTFFRMDEGADSGPILSQQIVQIYDHDDAASLYERILDTAQSQIKHFTNELVEGTAVFKEQDHSLATYWRKRSRKDGCIDFRMSAEQIYNLIRALAPPYPCAEFLFNGRYFAITKGFPVKGGIERNIEPGRVLDVEKDRLLIKTAGLGAIWIEGAFDADIQVGHYL